VLVSSVKLRTEIGVAFSGHIGSGVVTVYVRMCVCMILFINLCMYVCTYGSIYACMYG